MKHYKYLFMSVACFCLLGLIGLTYSKFTYSKEVSGSLTTIKPPSFAEKLIASATLDTNVDFSKESSSTNGQGLMMMNSTQNDEHPIVYYRGDVATNNVIFAEHCWLIVRTTETGGVKLVYNGVVNTDGSCNNYSGVGGATPNSNYSDVFVNDAKTNFNPGGDPIYVGYMYNDDVEYDVYEATGRTKYKSHLADIGVDSETGRHNQNKYDSLVKEFIDTWYENNIFGTNYESLLEDTVWCNDRSVSSDTYTIDNFSSKRRFYYSARTRFEEITPVQPILTCSRDVDSFTVDRANGNGDLTYPIALLTADETVLAGARFVTSTGTAIKSYLSLDSAGSLGAVYSMTPGGYSSGDHASVFALISGKTFPDTIWHYGTKTSHVRPAISLSSSAQIKSGNGSFTTPYIVG